MLTTPNAPLVLVADDDLAMRYVVVSTLQHEGFETIEASNGAEAIELFESCRPDAILMDVEMPGSDGYHACTEIRKRRGGTDVPVVMVTGLDDTESINRAFELGATDFIAKPINWSLIGHRLRYILRGAAHVRSLAVSEAENRALVEAIPDSLYIVSRDGLVMNHLRRSPGCEDVDLSGRPVSDVFPPDKQEDVMRAIEVVLATGDNLEIEYQSYLRCEESRWLESRFIRHAENRVLVINRDVSERKLAQERIHTLAYFDSLTGLPNKASFSDELQRMLQSRDPKSLAVFDIDLNRFKRINDTLGTKLGDLVLMEMSKRLNRFVEWYGGSPGCRCMAARIGGNEFAVALFSQGQQRDFSRIANELLENLAAPVNLNGHEFVITASVGIAAFPEHGKNAETLIKNAESARDAAKRLGRNTQRSYKSSMNSGVSECLDLENELRRAIEQNELKMYYQPKFSTSNLALHGAEALLRWHHPMRGAIPPSMFIPVAEESGLIIELGRWVASEVCQQIATWQRFGLGAGRIALNVSGKEFGLGDPVGTLTDAVSKAGICAESIELEITESVLVSDIRSVTSALDQLRQDGFTVTVDDFGTGYSSLKYLQNLPVDVLKIDASFVRDVDRNSESRAICTAVIALAKGLGLSVVGEGVENRLQLKFLKRQQCDTAQGYFLSKPMAADRFTELLKTGSVPRVNQVSGKVIPLGL